MSTTPNEPRNPDYGNQPGAGMPNPAQPHGVQPGDVQPGPGQDPQGAPQPGYSVRRPTSEATFSALSCGRPFSR